MIVVLHLGAHKTATTYIALRLATSRDALAARGIKCCLPDDLRPMVATERILHPISSRLGTPAPVRVLRRIIEREHRAGTRRLIVQDENLLGALTHLGRPGWFYDEAAAIPGRLDLPAGVDLRVLLSLRDYASFFASVHGFTLLRDGFRPFSDSHRAAILALERRWRDVVADIEAALPGDTTVTIWNYGRFRDLEDQILGHFVGPSAVEAVRPLARQALLGPSAKAVRRMMRLHENGETVDAARVRQVMRNAPKGPGLPGYSPWTRPELAELTRRYHTDLATLPIMRAR